MASAAGAQTTGTIEGTVLDALSGKPVGGAVVIAQSASLQGEQTAVTDDGGHFTIGLLPGGVYAVIVQHAGHRPFTTSDKLELRVDQTLKLKLTLVPESIPGAEVVIDAQRPGIDVSSTQGGGVVGKEQLRLVPYGRATRNFEEAATSIAGVHEDRFGVTMRGSGSPEGNYLIDGVNVTDPALGIQGTTLLLDFIEEVQVKAGGYQAEYGRSSGGVLSAVIKSGGNEVHGSVFGNWSPLELPRRTPTFPGSAIAAQESQRYAFDFGAEVGGPIAKDRLWFFLGAAPQVSSVNVDRVVLALRNSGQGIAAVDESGTPVLQEVARQRYTRTSTAYQFVGKLSWQVDGDHSLSLTTFGNPTKVSGAFVDPITPLRGNESTFLREEVFGSADAILHYSGKFLGKRLLFEANGGYHRQSGNVQSPTRSATAIGDVPAGALRDLPHIAWPLKHNLLDPLLQDVTMPASQRQLAACAVQTDGFDPCPVTSYNTGGAGALPDTTLDRVFAGLKLTWFFELAGRHQVRVGSDASIDRFSQTQTLSGGATATELRRGILQLFQNGHPDPAHITTPASDPTRPGHLLDDELEQTTRNFSAAYFAQDTWALFDRLVLDLGLRVEQQFMYADRRTLDANGAPIRGPQLSLLDVMPRLGIIYDPTARGLAKLYGSFGRFYQLVPLSMAASALSGTTQATALADATRCPAQGVRSILAVDPRFCALVDPAKNQRQWTFLGGAATEAVDPNLQGQFVDELQLGAQLQPWRDLIIGADYVHRALGRAVEDLSNNEGTSFFISNPGEPGKLGATITTPTGIAVPVPLASRVYDAITISARKTFSDHWLAGANWTYSSLRGNYPGLIAPRTTYLSPNGSSAFDLASALPNTDGPLPGDIPNSIKVDAGYEVDLAPRWGLHLGGNLRADEGQPIDLLGAHPTYGPGVIFVLPRGSAGRLPWVWALNLRAAASHRFGDAARLTVSLDVLNATNNRAATAVDENYTFDVVAPIVNGKLADLAYLKRTDGQPVTKNASFLTPTAYQLPLSARLGARVSF